MAEDDRVRDLHHRRLQVEREEQALTLCSGDLGVEEAAKRVDVQHRGVNDLPSKHGDRLAQHRRLAVAAEELDAQRARRGDHRGLFSRAEVLGDHVGDVGPRVGAPWAHSVRMSLRVVLHRRRRAPVRVPLAQHRVDGAPHHVVIAGARLDVLVRVQLVGVVRERVAELLELGDRRLQLGQRSGDIRQLDDVRPGALRERAELGERVADALRRLEAVGEAGDDPSGEGDVASFDGDARRRGVGTHHRQERIRRQCRGLIGVRVDDGRVSHSCSASRREQCLAIKIDGSVAALPGVGRCRSLRPTTAGRASLPPASQRAFRLSATVRPRPSVPPNAAGRGGRQRRRRSRPLPRA